MTAPFRDELTAALEHAEKLEAENEELRARVETKTCPADPSAEVAGLRRQIDELKEENERLLSRAMDLDAKLRAAESTPAIVKIAVVAFILGIFVSAYFFGHH